MMRYFLRNYCESCFGQDFEGCFNGSYEALDNEDAIEVLEKLDLNTQGIEYNFDTFMTEDISLLHCVGEKISSNLGLWRYQILTEDHNVIFDSGE